MSHLYTPSRFGTNFLCFDQAAVNSDVECAKGKFKSAQPLGQKNTREKIKREKMHKTSLEEDNAFYKYFLVKLFSTSVFFPFLGAGDQS